MKPPKSPYLVPFDGDFRVRGAATLPPEGRRDPRANKKRLKRYVKELRELQRKLYADDRYSLLLVFQAMDAAGKDGTIRALLTGVNPAGCQVSSFKKPSAEELDHDFLWRTARRLPERGRIGVFNRSYYEEVLVVRVHPSYLRGQRLPGLPEDPSADDLDALWEERYASIRQHERHLQRNGTVILKFWLNVSPEEQKRRLLRRIDDPSRNWKFSEVDVAERAHWPRYMEAYEDLLRATSRRWAPWYAIPADDKPFMRAEVARITVEALRKLDLSYPHVSQARHEELLSFRAKLEAQRVAGEAPHTTGKTRAGTPEEA